MAFKAEFQQEWNRRYADEFNRWRDPDPSLPALYDDFLKPAFPNGGRAVDVAGGMGRHAMWLAERNWQVEVWDYSDVALQNMAKIAAERQVKVATRQVDVHTADFGQNQFDMIMAFYFLDRSILPKLSDALRPGGFLLYKTYTLEQLAFDKGPKDEEYLLRPNELLQAFSQLHVVHYSEAVTDGGRAEILAQKR